ncbi:hypothetical protein ACFCP7_28340 [Paenibacillus elgii]
MKNTLKALIDSKVSSNKIRVTQLVDSEETVKWIPLLLCKEHGTIIGVSTDARWAIEEKKGLRILDEPWKFLRVMVLLEQPMVEIHNSLTEAFKEYQIFIDVHDVFPFVEIVEVGFEQKSDYWADLALNWFTHLSRMEQEELLDSLKTILEARWASQDFRHRVKKELRKIEKN